MQIMFTKENVVEKLKQLKTDKGPGIDELHPKFLHDVRKEIGEVLAQIFNKSMQTRDVPQEWRDALIMPLFKKGNRSYPCKYRKVSLTSVMCKVKERIVKDNIVEHLNEYNVIKGSQHGFTRSRSSLYCGLPQVRLRPLNGVLRAAARMIGGVPKFGHTSDYMRDVLHWLPVQQRIHYRISSIVWHCVLGNAPSYLLELFNLTSACFGRRSLRSATKGDFLVPRARTATRQKRAFSIVGPSVWNDLPSELRSLPRDLSSSFYKLLKTLLFGRAWAGSASE